MALPQRPRASIHRRNRDIDGILIFFLFLFVSFEFTQFLKTEEEAMGPLAETGQQIKNTNYNHSNTTASTIIDERPSIEVNWDHILSNPECELSDNDESPLPLVFMALGRTGSSITWATVAKMTEIGDPSEPVKAIEIVGRINVESTDFFNNIPDKLSSSWPSSYICDLQTNFTRRGLKGSLVGFQWKPYKIELDNPRSLAGLRDLASSNDAGRRHPSIRVIYQTRNPIDRRLSNWRHRGHSMSEVPPHCKVGDGKCLKEHQKFDQRMNFTDGKELLHWLKQDKNHENNVFQHLTDAGVDYIHVAYEKLYSSGRGDEVASEWMRIFRFLGRGPSDGLIMKDVRKNFEMAKTSSKNHKDMMLNYEEVKKTLEGTEFEEYLN
jgi:hypothetical protein